MSGILGTRVMAALATMFNVLALNLVLLVASLPVVTLPAAVNAAMVALGRWRSGDLESEDRVVREFVLALRSSPRRISLLNGVPLAAVVFGVAEVHHFARGAGVLDRVCLGLGCGALLVTLMGVGYVFVLVAGGFAGSAAELWSLCAGLAIRNALVTGPLFLLEIAGSAVLAVIDPALVLLGLPLLLVYLLTRTARFGLTRVGRHQPSPRR